MEEVIRGMEDWLLRGVNKFRLSRILIGESNLRIN